MESGPEKIIRILPNEGVRQGITLDGATMGGFFRGGTIYKFLRRELNFIMQFEDQSAAMRQMKELLRDQAKFRAKLDRVVRKIETSSERTAKLAERNKARAQKSTKHDQQDSKQPRDTDEGVHGNGLNGDGDGDVRMEAAGATSAQPAL